MLRVGVTSRLAVRPSASPCVSFTCFLSFYHCAVARAGHSPRRMGVLLCVRRAVPQRWRRRRRRVSPHPRAAAAGHGQARRHRVRHAPRAGADGHERVSEDGAGQGRCVGDAVALSCRTDALCAAVSCVHVFILRQTHSWYTTTCRWWREGCGSPSLRAPSRRCTVPTARCAHGVTAPIASSPRILQTHPHASLCPLFLSSASPSCSRYAHQQIDASMQGTLFGSQDAHGWNLDRLDTPLRRYGEEVDGITRSMIYVGSWRSMFAFHTEV